MRDQTATWLDALYAGMPGLVEVRALTEGKPPHRHWCASQQEALAAIEREAERGSNVYAGVATRRAAGSGRKSDLSSMRAVWADVDYGDGLSRERHERHLAEMRWAPSIRIATGGGEHNYWLLDPPVDVSTVNGVERVEAILRGLTDVLGADRAATDASRILRVPGTHNYPDARKRARGRVPAACTIISMTEHLYSLDDLAPLGERGRRQQPRTSATARREGARAWDGALPEPVALAMQIDPTLRLLISKRCSELGYPSASEADYALACRLIELGRIDSEIEAALRWRHAHTEPRPKDLQYFGRTVAAARSRASVARRASS